MSYESYVKSHPDLIKHYREVVAPKGHSIEAWGEKHWEKHGEREIAAGRRTGATPGGGVSAASSSNRADSGPQASSAGSQHEHEGSGQTFTAGTLKGPGWVDPASQTIDNYGNYVDQYSGLKDAYDLIKARSEGRDLSGFKGHGRLSAAETADYWLDRMGGDTSKEAFGRAHYGESSALHEGTYQGTTQMPWGTGVRRYDSGSSGTPAGNQPGQPMGNYVPSGDPNNTENYINPSPTSPFLDSVDDLSLMQNQIANMINKNNPLFKSARTKALQIMSQTGTVNSSMAEEAVMNAIMNVVMPIAQNDANTYFQMQQTNQEATNAFKLEANKAFYEEALTRLNLATSRYLGQLSSNTSLMQSILSARTSVATTPMGADAANWALGTVTPTWFSNWTPWA